MKQIFQILLLSANKQLYRISTADPMWIQK